MNLDDQLLLSDAIQRKIFSMSPGELIELFFSREIKDYIIEVSEENSLQFSIEELNCFVQRE